jgi:hypothetical protein
VFLQSEATGRTELRAERCTLHEYRREEALRCLARPDGQAAVLFLGAPLESICLPFMYSLSKLCCLPCPGGQAVVLLLAASFETSTPGTA